jgi:hypothetical protein
MASIYAVRPIPHFVAYMGGLLQSLGHDIEVLACDGALGTCNNHVLRRKARLLECLACCLGGVRSFENGIVTSMRPAKRGAVSEEVAWELAYSTAITTSRVEDPKEFHGPLVRSLQKELAPGLDIAVGSANRWLARRRIDAVVLFNGRLDATAGVLYACRENGIPFVTFDRSLMGHGIWMVPNASCLSTKCFESMMSEFSDRPLTALQARVAGGFLARRLLRQSRHEFRVFNADARPAVWPLGSTGLRVLVLPSSRNELEGHSEWASEYVDLPSVLPILLDKLSLAPSEVVIRGHPIWASRFGSLDVSPALAFWRQYATVHGYHFVDSASRESSQDLMADADLVVLNGSSAALEAGALGKKILCFGHSDYVASGIAVHIRNRNEWPRLTELEKRSPAEIVRKTLRHALCVGWRYPQFVRYVRADGPTRYTFYEGASAERLAAIIQSGRVVADWPDTDCGTEHEDEVIDRFLGSTWRALAEYEGETGVEVLPIKRRPLLRWIDPLRAKFPKGDML